MRRLVLLSFGLLFAVLLGCSDPSGPRADSYSAETSAAFFLGGGASISLEKSTNGQDADVPQGPSITSGDPVVWEYRVTNTGSETLSGVFLLDDREAFICTIGTLAVGAEVVCRQEEGVAQTGSYTNVGTVNGYSSGFLVKASDPSHYEGETSGGRTPSVQEVDIQIKPGGTSPCINASSKGRTPVAILASSEFDPLVADPPTILAGGLTSPVRWGRGEDVNGDGLLDLVVHFKTQDLNGDGLLQDGVELMISGKTLEGGRLSENRKVWHFSVELRDPLPTRPRLLDPGDAPRRACFG